jgi:hypothetical protein
MRVKYENSALEPGLVVATSRDTGEEMEVLDDEDTVAFTTAVVAFASSAAAEATGRSGIGALNSTGRVFLISSRSGKQRAMRS